MRVFLRVLLINLLLAQDRQRSPWPLQLRPHGRDNMGCGNFPGFLKNEME